MWRGKWNLWVGMTMFAALSAGCCQPEKDQIAALTRDKATLTAQNSDLVQRQAASDAREKDLITRLGDKDAEISHMSTEITILRSRPAGPDANAGRGKTAPGWKPVPFGDMVTVGSDLLFDSGKAALKTGGKAALDKIVADIKSHYNGKVVRVLGHTDKDPIKKSPWDDNWELSANRALTVARYLRDHGVSAQLIEPVAMGEFHPEPGATGKARNRRVEIYVEKK